MCAAFRERKALAKEEATGAFLVERRRLRQSHDEAAAPHLLRGVRIGGNTAISVTVTALTAAFFGGRSIAGSLAQARFSSHF